MKHFSSVISRFFGPFCLVQAVLFLAIVNPAIAATDAASEIQRQQQREEILRKNLEASPDVKLPAVKAEADSEQIPEGESPCFVIRQILLVGDESERFRFGLQSVLSANPAIIGRCLGVQGINAVLARVQNAIVARGYVTTRVLVAPQNLSTGELQLTVIPGRIRNIRMSPDSDRLNLWNALPAKPGDLLNLRDIEMALENLKRVPTADADIKIEPAAGPDAKPGESDLVVSYKQAFPFRLTFSADDGGSVATGKHQGGVTLSGDNLLMLNDLFYFNYSHDMGDGKAGRHGTLGRTLHYSLPFGYWLLGITASENAYHQTTPGATQDYLYSGTSSNAEIKLSRMLYRDATRKTTLTLAPYLKTSRNYIEGEEVANQRRRMAGWKIDLNHREFIGAASLDLNIAFRRGTGMLDALKAQEEKFDEGTARPKIVTADAELNLPFHIAGQSLRYSSNWRAQWNQTKLVPQDRFSIGGRYTVRGYDGETILSAGRGWLVRNDLALMFGETGQELYLGADYGHVGGQEADLLVGTELAGAVVGLRGGYKGVSWDLFAGGPLHKPTGFKPATGVAGFNLSWTY